MCIVIDANTLSHVFNKIDEKHPEFKPVLDWILEGQGKVVYGGTKYLKEIGAKYIPVLAALKVANKAIRVSDSKVDAEAVRLSSLIQHKDFDDQHIVALLKVSGCKLISSLDARAYPYFHHSLFFTARKRPKIYSSIRNVDLLATVNIAKVCIPCFTLSQKMRGTLPI